MTPFEKASQRIDIIQNHSFLVGGAVRDFLMGVPVHDSDYVVVGITPQQMIDAGFDQVGADFPVFLDPVTREEYALARTERKSGTGYKGFITDYNTNVTLEEDLIRRDLTINAMAMDTNGTIIDPFGGQEDLKNHILRAPSEAFKDDPLRVLRVARFACKFSDFFIIEASLEDMCREVGRSEEFKNLTAERVGQELLKALGTNHPSSFFTVLNQFGCLDVHFPEIAALIGQSQPEQWHPEGDAFNHTLLVLQAFIKNEKEAVQHTVLAGEPFTLTFFKGPDLVGRFCALTHDLGKGLTPKERLPHHPGHELIGVPVVAAMCDRLRLSTEFKKAAMISCEFHGHVHNLYKLNPKTLVKFAERVRGNLADFERVGDISKADAQGRGKQHENDEYKNGEDWKLAIKAISAVTASSFMSPEMISNLTVERIKSNIYNRRLRVAKQIALWDIR